MSGRSNNHIARICLRAVAPALVAALAFALPVHEAAAQDVPWGKKTEKPAPKKQPPQKQAPVQKAPAQKAPAQKAPAQKAPVQKPQQPTQKAPGQAQPQSPAVAPEVKKLAPEAAAKEAKPTAPEAQAPKAPVTDLLAGFKALLEPHGDWVEDPTYGLVWVPDPKEVGENFAPYQSGGRWGVTDKGDWAWVSSFDWGKVPFHYGRWIWTPERKWAWIPGEEYAPAWVVWRTGDAGYDFVGWAPMAPTHYWIDGAPVRASSGVLPFYFVSTRHLFAPDVGKHVVTDRKLGKAIHEHSKIHPGHTAAEGAQGSAPMGAASPTFGEARIPPFAIPKSRLSAVAEEVAPLTLESVRGLLGLPALAPAQIDDGTKAGDEAAGAETPDAPQAPEAQATPEAQPAEGERFATPPPVVDDEPKRFATPPPVYNKKRIRYRCWWTNTRPRIWRCGY